MSTGEREPGTDPDAHGEARLEALFQAFLEGLDKGRDLSVELLAEAGEQRAGLEAKVRLELELRSLSRELGLGSKLPGAPQQLGRFQILGLLGQGGISRVFLAHDPELGRRIALKVLDREVLLDKDQRAWILNEARSLARLDHPHVVKVFESGETETHTYVAMELLSGPSLDDVIQAWRRRREGGEPAPVVDALAARLEPYSARIQLLAQLAEALAECHDHGILHRDIKPKNVIFDAAGSPHLIDFGLAHVEGGDEDSRLGLTQALVGTAAYIAPEQVTSDQTGANPRSDQFSFATLAYECFALENPFARKSRRAILAAIEEADPEPLRRKAPAIPPALATVIGHAHAVDPAARYPGMAAFAADLRAILAHRPVSVEEASLPHLARLWLRRHRRAVTAASAGLLATLALVGTVWFLSARAEREELRAALAEIRPEEFVGALPFEACFERLLELKQRAESHDEGFLRTALLGTVRPEVEQLIHTWAAQLGRNYAQELQVSREASRPMQEVLYRRLFAKEEVLCAECTENLAYRKRGTVQLPLDEIGMRQKRLDMVLPRPIPPDICSVLVPTTPTEYLLPGLYRLQVWESEAKLLSYETVFHVPEGWLPAVVVQIRKPREALLKKTVEVTAGLGALRNGQEAVRIPKFLLMPYLVTSAEFLEFAQETGYALGQMDLSKTEDSPACPTLAGALAFAAWAGGRLPFSHEVRRAEELGYIQLEPDPLVSAEYLLDASLDAQTQYLSYHRDDLRLKVVVGMDTFMRDTERTTGAKAGIGLRLAFPADSPMAYQQCAEEPIVALPASFDQR